MRAIKLQGDDCVVGADVLYDDKPVLTVAEDGLGRLSPASEYPIHARAGLGQINFRCGKYGHVVNVQSVNANDDLMIITASGMMVRISLEGIAPHSRTAKGVKIMNLSDGDRIISAVPVAKAKISEISEVTDATETNEADTTENTEE